MSEARIAISLSALVLCLATQAQAQTATPSSVTPVAPDAVAERSDTGVGDIIVTAQRRAESLQKSSLAIEVFTGDKLLSATKPTDLTSLTPGVQVGTSGPQPQVYIRGVGDTNGNSRGQGAVAFNIDGIYYARATQVGPSMFDIARLEILKGPQGTLYGRNASGGAVNIITRAPELGAWRGHLIGEVGNFDLFRGEAAVNIPLGAVAALRVSGQITRRDGYLSDGSNDERTESARARFLFQPSDRFSVLLNGDISHIGGVGGGYAVYPSPGNAWRGTTAQPLPWPFQFAAASVKKTPDDRMIDSDNKGASLEMNAKLGFATLTFIPAYRQQDQFAIYFSTDFQYVERFAGSQTSGELRLSNSSPMLKWVAGLFYFNEKQAQVFTGDNRLIGGSFDSNRDAYAAFGEATVSVTPKLRLIAGGRYTTEKIRGGYTAGTGSEPYIPYVATTPRTAIAPLENKKFNYRLGVEFDAGPQSMLFATYATGFKAGGFTPTRACGPLSYQPESLGALTVGARNRFAANRIQFNVEGFRWKYKNQQVGIVQADPCGTIAQLVVNPGSATIAGGNADLVLRPARNTTVHLAVEYTHGKYDRFSFNQLGLAPYTPTSGSLCSATPLASPAFFQVNCAGQQTPRTPEWSGIFGFDQVIPLGDGKITAGADAQFASKRWLDYGYTPNGHAPGYVTVNAQIGYQSPGGTWSVTAYVNNLNNAKIYTGGVTHTVIAPNGYPYIAATIQPPRMFGVRLRYNFGD